MIITNIEKQKNNDKRYNIYIDNNFSFAIDEQNLIYFKLEQNSEITIEKYNYIVEFIIYNKAKDKAFNFLSYKSRTEKELRDKLQTENYNLEIIDKVVDLLKKYNYINDKSYAQDYINTCIRLKPMGKRMIKYELQRKGIDNHIIEAAIEAANIDELDLAISLLNKKLKSNKEIDIKTKKRLYNYLVRKGFDLEIINKSFKLIDANM